MRSVASNARRMPDTVVWFAFPVNAPEPQTIPVPAWLPLAERDNGTLLEYPGASVIVLCEIGVV